MAALLAAAIAGAAASAEAPTMPPDDRHELGRRMYMDGILPSGEPMTARVRGDIELSGEQVICGACHRRSGLGSSEGPQVVPGVTSYLLYEPFVLPTSRPPAPPVIRPAYDEASIRAAIRAGIGASGQPLSPLMPRYALGDEDLDILLHYMKTLSTAPSPGVGDEQVHFATIVADSVPAEARTAVLDVMHAFVEQKNTETRYESKRATAGPWHKDWQFKSYRKWVLHVWELTGPAAGWPAQLETAYRRQPVFAVVGGLAPGSWAPIHDFCARSRLPCLFPTTDLPVDDPADFYNVYFSRGLPLEAAAVARHMADESLGDARVVQVYADGDAYGQAAAAALRDRVGARLAERVVPAGAPPAPPPAFWSQALAEAEDGVLVVWLDGARLSALWPALLEAASGTRVYLSSALQEGRFDAVPDALRERVYFAHSHEMPERVTRLLLRSTGWLRTKRIYSRRYRRLQGDAFFALKVAGGAMRSIGGFFLRDYFLEQIEHMVDNANYTSVYAHMSLAPDQRFVSKGCYIARVAPGEAARLTAVSDWLIPD